MNVRTVIPPDAIPSIDDPRFDDTHFGDESDEVIVVEGEPARAYPIRILHYHEIVNDVVDGDPLAITWCPLCGSAMVYERVVNGRTLTFGVSGKLADDDLVMYDRETGSEWKQSLGRCIAGQYEGTQLPVRPAGLMAYGEYRSAHRDGLVLQPTGDRSEAASEDDNPARIDYDKRPYEAYFESAGFGLDAHRTGSSARPWTRTDLEPKAVVLGIEHGDGAVGFPLERVRGAGGVVTDTIDGLDVVVFGNDTGIHAYEDPGFPFRSVDGGFEGDGTVWNPATGLAEDGRQLRRVPAKWMFAFTWQDDHGPEAFYEP